MTVLAQAKDHYYDYDYDDNGNEMTIVYINNKCSTLFKKPKLHLSQQVQKIMKCSQCDGDKFDEDPARGDMICLECGAVMSENVVTAAVEYVEYAGGASTAIGRFVSDESQMPGFRESRYITEQKARRRIETICGQLRLGPDVAVSAFRYYQSALFRGLTRGRSAMQLAAACIYVAARQLRVNLMLLDLSDAVAINVYQVGRTYIDLKRRLNLSLPEIDPCLFVERFASQLDFEDKTAAVATTAMRLLQRMKKDWLSTGRRPSGLAAASLLVAARIHEFNRSEEDVAKVARISQMTARRRLVEFSKTPSSALSIDAFFNVDYDEESDPPAFGQPSQKKRNNLNDLDMNQVALEIKELGRRIDLELDQLSEKRKRGAPLTNPDLAKSKGFKHLFAPEKQAKLEIDGGGDEEQVLKEQLSESSPSNSPTSAKKLRSSRQVLRDCLDGVVEPDILDSCVDDLQLITAHSGNQLCHLVKVTHNARDAHEAAVAASADLTIAAELAASCGDSKDFDADKFISDASLKLPHFISPIDQLPSTSDMKDLDLKKIDSDATDVKDIPMTALDLIDIDEEELDREYFLGPQEVMVKATLWFQENAGFLEAQRKKKTEKQKLKEELAKLPKKSRRGPRKIYQRQRRMNWNKDEDPDVDEDEVIEKPISKKINYAALEAIVGTSNTTTTSSSQHLSSINLTPSVITPLPSLLEQPPAPSERPNRLLEATLRDTEIGSDLFPVNQAEEEEEDDATCLEEEEDLEEEEEEEDWGAGDDLW